MKGRKGREKGSRSGLGEDALGLEELCDMMGWV